MGSWNKIDVRHDGDHMWCMILYYTLIFLCEIYYNEVVTEIWQRKQMAHYNDGV